MHCSRTNNSRVPRKRKQNRISIYFCAIQNIGLGPVYLIKDDDDGNDGDDKNNNKWNFDSFTKKHFHCITLDINKWIPMMI